MGAGVVTGEVGVGAVAVGVGSLGAGTSLIPGLTLVGTVFEGSELGVGALGEGPGVEVPVALGAVGAAGEGAGPELGGGDDGDDGAPPRPVSLPLGGGVVSIPDVACSFPSSVLAHDAAPNIPRLTSSARKPHVQGDD